MFILVLLPLINQIIAHHLLITVDMLVTVRGRCYTWYRNISALFSFLATPPEVSQMKPEACG